MSNQIDNIVNAIGRLSKEDKEAVYNQVFAAKEDDEFSRHLSVFNGHLRRRLEEDINKVNFDTVAAEMVNCLR